MPAAACARCDRRQKGFASLGGVRSAQLSSLGIATAVNLATEEQCSQGACQVGQSLLLCCSQPEGFFPLTAAAPLA